MSGDLPKYVHRRKTRHGKWVYHFSRTGRAPYIRIREIPGTPQFWATYALLIDGKIPPKRIVPTNTIAPIVTNTFRWLVVQYIKARIAKAAGKPNTGIDRDKQTLDNCCLEPIKPKEKRTFANLPLTELTRKHLGILRDRKSIKGFPTAANARVAALKRMCSWATEEEILTIDPSLYLKEVEHTEQSHRIWSPEDVTKYEDRWPIGTTQRLAMALMLQTGASRVDVVKLGQANLVAGTCRYIRTKTKKKDVEANVPVPQILLDIIARTPTGIRTFLVSAYGKPYTPGGFGNRFASWCKKARVDGRAHGLRHAAATRDADRGATTHELCAMYGWLTLAQAQRYTSRADRRRLGQGAARLAGEQK